MKKRSNLHSAKDGRFVTKAYAKRYPHLVVRVTEKKRRKKPYDWFAQ